jgi:hypothetical protein
MPIRSRGKYSSGRSDKSPSQQVKQLKLLKRLIYVISAIIILIPAYLCSQFVASNLMPRQSDHIRSQIMNDTRQPLSDDATASEIFPLQIGAYVFNGTRSTSGSMYFQHYFHREYKSPDGAKLRFEAAFLKEGYSLERVFWDTTFCGNRKGTPKLFLDEGTPFGYAFCEGPLLTHYVITWMSGKWLLRASASSLGQSDQNMLLEFVNQYDY